MTGLPETKKASAPFVIMAKPVGSACNLRCSYCYYLSKDTGSLFPHPTVMDDATLGRFIKSYMESSPGPVVSFTWHGGEPALAGLDFFEKVVSLEKKYLPDGFSCWNSLQTNGTLLTDEWCAFLKREKFDVGLSIDGAKWVHDEFRRDLGGGVSYDRSAAAIERLKQYGILPDLLCTVTSESAKDPLAVYRSLRNFGTGWIQFIPIVRRDENGNVTPDSVSPEDYGEFLCRIFDDWKLHDLGRCGIQFFAESAAILAGVAPSLCVMAPVCGRVLVVERDGSVFSCDHFVESRHRIGNILEDSLADLADCEKQEAFGERKRALLPERCKSCEALAICNGGCPKDRFIPDGDPEKPLYYLCAGIRRFYSHAAPSLRKISALQRQNVPNPKIMEMLLSEERDKWKGVGRNDPCPCGSGKKAKNCCWSIRP